MASLLAKLCKKPAPKERPPGLKRQSTSTISDNSDSESDENFHKSGKRRRHTSLSDDNISLHASDDLDDVDDIKMLTECSKATGQKEREIPAKETQLLQDFANGCQRRQNPAKAGWYCSKTMGQEAVFWQNLKFLRQI